MPTIAVDSSPILQIPLITDQNIGSGEDLADQGKLLPAKQPQQVRSSRLHAISIKASVPITRHFLELLSGL